jgi:sporulation protein YlmC with PRC-barrel domain
MTYHSARHLLGLAVTDSKSQQTEILGTIESVTINPTSLRVDGFLIGQAGRGHAQAYLARECVLSSQERTIEASNRLTKRPPTSHRILGLSAWTTHPRFLVGFVHDVNFSWETGTIESFVIHQLIRNWTIPTASVEKITPRALLIHNDTTIKLKITPFPAEPA